MRLRHIPDFNPQPYGAVPFRTCGVMCFHGPLIKSAFYLPVCFSCNQRENWYNYIKKSPGEMACA